MEQRINKEYVINRLILSILEAQVSLLFVQNQSLGPVWNDKTNPNLPGSIKKASLILNAQKSELNKKAQAVEGLDCVLTDGWTA